LQIAQYSLAPIAIRYERDDGTKGISNLKDSAAPYVFQPNEYAVVVVEERIILPDGVIGRFIPASGLIEKGFGLTAGKLDSIYGSEGEEIRFGLKNLKNKLNEYRYKSPLAYIQFFDIRGLPANKFELRDYDRKVREMRKSGGVDLEDSSEG